MNELNPNHPVTQQMRQQWHKLCAIMMTDFGVTEFEVTPGMIKDFADVYGEGAAVVADMRDGRCVLRIVRGAEAARLAKEEGGLPV